MVLYNLVMAVNVDWSPARDPTPQPLRRQGLLFHFFHNFLDSPQALKNVTKSCYNQYLNKWNATGYFYAFAQADGGLDRTGRVHGAG
jgi:hypothetical protein